MKMNLMKINLKEIMKILLMILKKLMRNWRNV